MEGFAPSSKLENGLFQREYPLFVYKNLVYKNIKAEIGDFLRISGLRFWKKYNFELKICQYNTIKYILVETKSGVFIFFIASLYLWGMLCLEPNGQLLSDATS